MERVLSHTGSRRTGTGSALSALHYQAVDWEVATIRLGALGLGRVRMETLREVGNFEVLDVQPSDGIPASVAGLLLGWSREGPAVVHGVRSTGYRGPLIAALEGRSVNAVASALAHGCDDAQPFPLHPRELAARIGAIRRRAEQPTRQPPPWSKRIRCDRLDIGWDGSDPLLDGKPLKVSPNCARVLAIVARSSYPVPLFRIAAALYGAEPPPSKTINTYLCMLRSIMTAATGQDGWLTLRDGGYVLHHHKR